MTEWMTYSVNVKWEILIMETLKTLPTTPARSHGQDWQRRPGLALAAVGRRRRPAARRREVSRLTADQLVG